MIKINVRVNRRDDQEYVQSRDTGKIGYTSHRTKTNKI